MYQSTKIQNTPDFQNDLVDQPDEPNPDQINELDKFIDKPCNQDNKESIIYDYIRPKVYLHEEEFVPKIKLEDLELKYDRFQRLIFLQYPIANWICKECS